MQVELTAATQRMKTLETSQVSPFTLCRHAPCMSCLEWACLLTCTIMKCASSIIQKAVLKAASSVPVVMGHVPAGDLQAALCLLRCGP